VHSLQLRVAVTSTVYEKLASSDAGEGSELSYQLKSEVVQLITELFGLLTHGVQIRHTHVPLRTALRETN
jgi:hypothetical protein